jgi:hypothetical protein
VGTENPAGVANNNKDGSRQANGKALQADTEVKRGEVARAEEYKAQEKEQDRIQETNKPKVDQPDTPKPETPVGTITNHEKSKTVKTPGYRSPQPESIEDESPGLPPQIRQANGRKTRPRHKVHNKLPVLC